MLCPPFLIIPIDVLNCRHQIAYNVQSHLIILQFTLHTHLARICSLTSFTCRCARGLTCPVTSRAATFGGIAAALCVRGMGMRFGFLFFGPGSAGRVNNDRQGRVTRDSSIVTPFECASPFGKSFTSGLWLCVDHAWCTRGGPTMRLALEISEFVLGERFNGGRNYQYSLLIPN